VAALHAAFHGFRTGRLATRSSRLGSCSLRSAASWCGDKICGANHDADRGAKESLLNFTLVTVVAVALFFDFTNGFHDAANAVATTVSTRALTPRIAVGFAAILNFAGAFISLKVATTVGKGIVDPNVVTLKIVLAGVVGAIGWNLTTWLLGLPTSSSHALIGGVMGSAIAAHGVGVVNAHGLYKKVLVPSLASPFLGLVLGAAIVGAIMWLFKNRGYGRTTRGFRRLQIVSAGFVALAHGTNDAQKTMGVIALALVAAHPTQSFHVPFWVILTCAIAMALGTYSGGWRIMRTLGQRVAHLDPHQGFAAETSTAILLWTTAHYGFPVSTTHTISGSVLGAGAAKRFSAVRWGIAGNIVFAWLLTIPAAGGVAALMEAVTRVRGGEVIVLAVAVAMAAGAFASASGRLRWSTRSKGSAALVAPPPA
jgi:PiT family inorganic phosphate transporter